STCAEPDAGLVLNALDCNDADATIHPLAEPVCGEDRACTGREVPCPPPPGGTCASAPGSPFGALVLAVLLATRAPRPRRR
ncbi:MAG: hypothetical protein KC656_14075, partial [Myxococcales bacterium]|nr:hypothetical protein [Myxococcales bacterium]